MFHQSFTLKKSKSVFPDQVRIAAAFYIGTEKEYTFPLVFFLLGVLTAMSMLLAEIFVRMKRKRFNPVPARSINYNHRTNMVISNLIPFPKLNLICAFDFVVMSIVKLFNPTQMGVPKLSLHGSILLFLLVFTWGQKSLQEEAGCLEGERLSGCGGAATATHWTQTSN